MSAALLPTRSLSPAGAASAPSRPSTYPEIGLGVLAACKLAAEAAGHGLDEILPRVKKFGLGTTAVTNVIATRTGLRTGLVTTKGFEETLRLARGRTQEEGGWLKSVDALVEARAIVGIDERIDRNGVVLKPLDPEQVIAAGRYLADEAKVESHRRLVPVVVPQPEPRARSGAADPRDAAGHAGHRRGRTAPGDPRIRAHDAGRAQRLCQGRLSRGRRSRADLARRRARSAGAAVPFGRRGDFDRAGARAAGLAFGLGPGGGGRGGGADRARCRRGEGLDLRSRRHFVRCRAPGGRRARRAPSAAI